MKITKDNISIIPENERNLVLALLEDLKEINPESKTDLFINWQEFHNEYSPEWTDPCPDYYGYYTIRSESDPYNFIGVEMDVHDLDNAMCLLYNYIVDL